MAAWTSDSDTSPAAGAPKFYNAPTMADPAAADERSGPRLSGWGTGDTLTSASNDELKWTEMSSSAAPDVRPPAQPLPDAPARGDRIGENGRFEIVERLGSGGMGHVFRAIDWHLDRTVAIKFILDNGGMPVHQLITLLRREAKATAKLNHENIVAIFDMDAYKGVPFLVMELLDGQSLDTMIDRSRLGPLRATQIMAQIARGLSHAHANGIIHRDLKPSNVFVLRDGRAKILDFGISRLERSLGATPAPAVTDGGPTLSGVGTPAFMAPEQWRGEAQDARTDIWAAGVVFFQMLTGRLPYTVPELLLKFRMKAKLRTLAPSARLLVPSLPEEADRVVATALSEDPHGRYPSARELLEALRELEHALGGAGHETEVSSRPAPQIERRPLTLLACSLEGIGALDLDDIFEIDQRFYHLSAEAVKRGDGSIGTPIGGKFFCCFGYPAVKETDAQRAVRAALQIAQAMSETPEIRGKRVDFKIGIHTGVVGLPNLQGPPLALPAMQGDVPNVAARLADSAPPGSVVLSQATLALTSGLFVTEPLPAPEGAPPRAPAVRALREAASISRFELAYSADLTPFVGREAELAFLHQLWDDAKEGRGQVVVVSGEPGIGKSRIVQALKGRVIEEQSTWLSCQSWPHFKNSALHPLIELILRSMNIQRDDPAEDKLSKLENSLASLGFTLADVLPLFGSLLGIPFEARYGRLGYNPDQEKIKTLEALASMLLRTALQRPVLFIIEDMHWVDHSTIEFLNALIDLVSSSRILVVLTSRPEFRVPWGSRRHLHQITLDRLPAAAAEAMIARASKGRALPPEMIERLVATTDGIPLFVEELTRMVVESWNVTETGQIARMAIPTTLHELLLARLDRLRGTGKEVAQIGAILGRDFHYEVIRRVSPLDELSLQEGLDILVEAGVLHHHGRPPASKYAFKHALIQQTAYQSLVKSDRQRHHQRAAQTLMEAFPETAEREPELIAHHHAEAGNLREAVDLYEMAGNRATQRSALVEAIDHYTRAREALKGLPEGLARDKKELALLLAVGSPLMSVHGYATPEVERTYARARELARLAGGQADVFPAMQGLWQFYYVRGMLPTSRELGHQLLEIAQESNSSKLLLLAHRAIASSAFLQGDYETCRFHTQAGFSVYDMREHGSLALRTGHDPGVAHGVYLAWASWMLGHPDRSLTHVMEAMDLARKLAHPMTTAYALCFAALMRNHRGDHAEAKSLSEAALEITVPNKFALWTAWAKMQRGWAIAGMHDFEAGIPLMTEGLLGWKNTGARVGFTFFPVTLAEMCLRAGRLADVAPLLDDAIPMVQNNDEHFYEPELLRLKGELALKVGAEGAEAEAMAYFERGAGVARSLGGKSWELRLAMSRARLLARGGERARGAAELRVTLHGFTEGAETADQREARALLLELRDSLAIEAAR